MIWEHHQSVPIAYIHHIYIYIYVHIHTQWFGFLRQFHISKSLDSLHSVKLIWTRRKSPRAWSDPSAMCCDLLLAVLAARTRCSPWLVTNITFHQELECHLGESIPQELAAWHAWFQVPDSCHACFHQQQLHLAQQHLAPSQSCQYHPLHQASPLGLLQTWIQMVSLNFQWLGWRESLQETMGFYNYDYVNIWGFRVNVSKKTSPLTCCTIATCGPETGSFDTNFRAVSL